MTRCILFLCSISILFSCKIKNSTNSETSSHENETQLQLNPQKKDSINIFDSLPTNLNNERTDFSDFKIFKLFKLKDTINVDLNGDKVNDLAFFNINNKATELIIVDGVTNVPAKVGSDKSFNGMAENFDWVDFWGTTNDKKTFEILIKDDEVVGEQNVYLENTSLFVRKDEVGGGVITYKQGKYIWIHQSD